LWTHAAIVIVRAVVMSVTMELPVPQSARARARVCMHVVAVFSILIGTKQWILCLRTPVVHAVAFQQLIPVRVHRAVLSLTTSSSQVQERPEISAVLLHANLALQVVLNRPPVRAVHGDVDGL
jgi:hypothetical protein